MVWNVHPFSPYSHPEYTIIEGDVYFDRSKDIAMRAEHMKEREALEKLDMNRAPSSGGTPPRLPQEQRVKDRDEADKEKIDNE